MKRNQVIRTFTDLYERTVGDDSLVSSFIKGHLVVEFLLVKIVELSQPKRLNFAEGLNHYKLIQLVNGLGHISEGQKDTLILINQMRNKFAHQLTYEPSISDLKLILSKAAESFHDMTDGIMQGLDEIKDKTLLSECEDWVVPELFVQISYDLHSIYQDLGGDMENF
jgi:hypothetical protein